MTLSEVRRGFRRLLEAIVILLLAALAILVVLGVGFRKAGAALAWYDELASVLLAWLTYYGSCLAALHRSHIGFPRLVMKARPPLKRVLVTLREIVILGFFAVAAWAGVRVLGVLGGSALVTLPWVPMRLTQSVIPIGAVLFMVAELLSLTGGTDEGGPTA